MTTKTDKLIVELDADNARLRQKLGETNKDINVFGKNAVKSMDNFKRAAIAAFGVFTVTKLAGAVSDALEFADSIDKAAKAAGVGAQFLQEMRFAGDQTGISMLGLDDSMRRFNRRLGEFINSGGGPAKAALEELDIAVRDVNGSVLSTEDVFLDTVRGMQSLETTAQKSAIAAQLFGDDFGPKLVTLLERGVGGIQDLRDAALETGQVMTDEMVQSAVDAKDAITRLEFAAEGAKNQFILQFVPGLEDVATAMSLAAKESGLLEAAWVALGGVGAAIFTDEFDSDVEKLETLQGELRDLRNQAEVSKRSRGWLHDWVFGDVGEIEKSIGETEAAILAMQKRIEEAAKPKPLGLPGVRGAGAGAGTGAGETEFIKAEAERALKRQIAMEKASEKFIARRTLELQKGADVLVRSLDDELQAENRRYNEGIEALKQFRDEEVEIEGGYLIVKQKLEDDHASRIKKINEDMANDGKDTFAELTSAVNGWGTDFADNLLDAEGDFGDFADSVVRELARIAIAKATQPAFDAFGGFVSSALSSFIPGFANGTRSAPGGLAIVGERGPEVVNLPRGSQVIPNNALVNGGTTSVYVTMKVESLDPSRAAEVVGGALVQLKPLVTGIVEQSYQRRGRRGPLS